MQTPPFRKLLLLGNVILGLMALSAKAATTSPAITTQPVSATCNLGTTATLSVVASGTGVLTYQWYCNTVAVTGQTSATLSLGNVA